MKAAINRNIEHQVLKGGHARLARDRWSHPAEELPLLDEESTRFPSRRKGKRRKPKERCRANPQGHTHEWMKDIETVPLYEWEPPYVHSNNFRSWFINGRWSFEPRKRKLIGTYEVLYRLCAHCGKTQFKRGGTWKDSDKGYREAYKAHNGSIRIY